MKFKSLVTCFIFISFILISIYGEDEFFIRLRRYRKFYCGKDLVEMLRFLCGGYYYSKRSSESPQNQGSNELGPFWLTRSDAFRVLRYKRSQTGPVNECCNKPCYMNELLGYCDYRHSGGWILQGINKNITEIL